MGKTSTTTKLTVPVLKKRLDELLKIVRWYESDGRVNNCVTCGKFFQIKELQCGHFIKRGNLRLKYEKGNLHRQCVRCNKYLDGAQDKMSYYIIHRYGLPAFDLLVETDKMWQGGSKPPLSRADYVKYYNYWLEENRRIEKEYNTKIIPKSWEQTD